MICSKSLEGIQFTIDAANRIYCIEDFHKYELSAEIVPHLFNF